MRNSTFNSKYIYILPLSIFCIFLVISFSCISQSAPVLSYTTVLNSGLSRPVELANAADGSNRLFVVEQAGTVKIISGGVLQPGNFLNITDSVAQGGEWGLLSIAFHPNYRTNRYFYIYYSSSNGDITVARMQTLANNSNLADAASRVVLMRIAKPFSNHNGGHLQFGTDGNLYFGTGDGGSGGDPNNLSQNGNVLLGKMIRINVDNFNTPPYYTIPADNPFVANPTVRDEIFALGLRNPFRWSFDRLNNDMWIGDVGQGLWEEIDRRPFDSAAGVNYGWRCYEGQAVYNSTGCLPSANYTFPIHVYGHDAATGGFSVTGGRVYRGTNYPALYGYYICSDYVTGNSWLIKSNGTGGWNITLQTGLQGSIVSYAEDESGELFAVSLSGNLYRIVSNGALPVSILSFSATAFPQYNELKWTTATGENIAGFDIETSTDALQFTLAGRVTAQTNGTATGYSFRHGNTVSPSLFYRLKIKGTDNRITYSSVVKILRGGNSNINVYPTIVNSGSFSIVSSNPVLAYVLLNEAGAKMMENKSGNTASQSITVDVNSLAKGIYLLQIQTKEKLDSRKIIIQ